MWETACNIEVVECHRAHALAEVMFKPARHVARRRRRFPRHRPCLACLGESMHAFTRAAGLPHVVCDVSVVPCDVVRAGLFASRRSMDDFEVVP